jgi:hypothetical protein
MQSACVVLYCHLQFVRLYNIFRHYLINGTIFRKQVTEHKMCVLIFSTNFMWNISRPNQRDIIINVKTSSCNVPTRYSCRILMKLESSRKISGTSSTTKFHQDLSSGNRVVPHGRTDRHDEANSRFSQFCEKRLKTAMYNIKIVVIQDNY